MKKTNSILITILSAIILFGCGQVNQSTPMIKVEESEAPTDEISAIEDSLEVDASTEDVGYATTETAVSEEYDILEQYKKIRLVSILDSYDFNDDATLENGMWTILNDEDAEKEFLSYFFTDPSGLEVTEEANAKVYMGTVDDKNVFVSLFKNEEAEYPKQAYGFKYSLDNYKVEDINLDTLKPLLDYQEKEYFTDDNGKVVKVKYDSDPFEHGTYNSTGVLYYDSKERPLYRDYMVTNGGRYCYYLYNDRGEISQILDFGGMPYKGLEENEDIAIGVDFNVYIFER